MDILYSGQLTNVNMALINRVIYKFTNEHIYYKDYQKHQARNEWTVKLLHTSEARGFFEDVTGINYNIPWGHTGNKEVTIFMHNSKDLRKFMENMSVLTHELAHMLLYIYYPGKRYTLRNNENYSGFSGRRGQQRAFASGYVHDQLAEGKVRDFTVYQYVPRHQRIRFKVVDLREVTNSRNRRMV